MARKSDSLYYLTGIVRWEMNLKSIIFFNTYSNLSYGDNRCMGTGIYTKVSNYIDW